MQILGVCLIAAGALYFVGLFAYGKYKNRVVKVPSNSDVPRLLGPDEAPPAGTFDYLKMIQFESPKATEKEWWVYATQGLSKIAVVRSERDRLGGGPA